MFARLPLVLSTLAALPLLAADAAAGGLSIGFSKHGKDSSIGVQIGFPVSAPRPAPPQYGGHWETIVERVWVAPRYETRWDPCGRPIQVCVRAGYWDTVQHPGHYENRSTRVWREAGWKHGGPAKWRHYDD